jgi:hypothetical protein
LAQYARLQASAHAHARRHAREHTRTHARTHARTHFHARTHARTHFLHAHEDLRTRARYSCVRAQQVGVRGRHYRCALPSAARHTAGAPGPGWVGLGVLGGRKSGLRGARVLHGLCSARRTPCAQQGMEGVAVVIAPALNRAHFCVPRVGGVVATPPPPRGVGTGSPRSTCTAPASVSRDRPDLTLVRRGRRSELRWYWRAGRLAKPCRPPAGRV